MKVVDLRKELKTRGLSYAGDKAELITRLQAAISQDEHGDINLDSDEIDSDGVLEDEDDKSQTDILDDTAVDPLNEELALSDQPASKTTNETKPQRILKRKITATSIEPSKETGETKPAETKETTAKKIVLHRAISISSAHSEKAEESETNNQKEGSEATNNKIKITADVDTKTRLELRAKRFGLPIKMSEDERKEARKQRFGQSNSNITKNITGPPSGTLTENMEKLRKRAERFGQSVSKIMTDIEKKERLEKRKAKFGGLA
ncbi:unnamed protein product [Arctia plantaginis]|uniref:SAP domain-containing protein n=2 Tax=Arctia plantaginis TaxID=874455 RepID=A0A8S1A1X4_ARCPL|nr:unnamed protein product [Arctia plantaginis]CAB3238383.1 unnamed protein product [Arctia plantaginis]